MQNANKTQNANAILFLFFTSLMMIHDFFMKHNKNIHEYNYNHVSNGKRMTNISILDKNAIKLNIVIVQKHLEALYKTRLDFELDPSCTLRLADKIH